MKPERLRFALKYTNAQQWRAFEDLALQFLASEYENLRPMANQGGDGGKDAILLDESGEILVAIQCSIQPDWKKKIKQTTERLKETTKKLKTLVYLTNQEIGAKADDLRTSLRKEQGILLDVRDSEWFISRMNTTDQTERATNNFSESIINPIMSEERIIETNGQALPDHESRAAFVYMGLQLIDDDRNKGLTKLAFESLVRSSLRGSSPERLVTRSEIKQRVRRLLPNHQSTEVDKFTDSAINRLIKKHIRHHTKEDAFCLTYEERNRLEDLIIIHQGQDAQFESSIKETIGVLLGEERSDKANELSVIIRKAIEMYLFNQGELFANAVSSSGPLPTNRADIVSFVKKSIASCKGPFNDTQKSIDAATKVMQEILSNPSDVVQRYLRCLADSYTLFAFLRETPDIQSAIIKLFTNGDFWLDTNVILPLFAETLLDEDKRKFTNIFKATNEAGIKLFITEGVLEELEKHMSRCLRYSTAHGNHWQGNMPFLYSCYFLNGNSDNGFTEWLDTFRGQTMPSKDIADYLKSEFSIQLQPLQEELEKASSDLRIAVKEIFIEAKEKRKNENNYLDPATINKLADHDVENYIGVIARRKKEKDNPSGHTTWWVTLSHTAMSVENQLKGRIKSTPPISPVLSLDFLVNYLAIGPLRQKVSKGAESLLPVMIDLGINQLLPKDLIEIANGVRSENKNLPKHLQDRKVRDALMVAKMKFGPIALGGSKSVAEDLKRAIRVD